MFKDLTLPFLLTQVHSSGILTQSHPDIGQQSALNLSLSILSCEQALGLQKNFSHLWKEVYQKDW